MSGVKFHWPQNKRIAVSALLMFEVWSEGKAPPYSAQTSPLKPGTLDHSGINYSYYGGYSGAQRLARTMSDFDMRGTFCTSARCIDIFPETVTELVERGHDIAAHGITQDDMLSYHSPQEQEEIINRCVDAFERHTGKRPEGWISPTLGWTPETIGLIAKARLNWYGDLNYLDLPKMLNTEHGSVVGIPVTDFSDLRVFRSNPHDLVDVYKDTFDYLYRHEPTSMITFVMHCHWGGRPLMVAAFRQVLEYMARYPDVWFTSHGEIARWSRELGIDAPSYSERFPMR